MSIEHMEDAPKAEASVSQKRKRGTRGVNQVQKSAIMYITHVSGDGIPEKPLNVVSKF